jgi:carboxyl-terminal processing protease
MRKSRQLFFCFFAFSSTIVFSQSGSLQSKAITVKRMIQLNHISPRVVNDSFSAAVFTKMIDAADPRRLLFTDAEFKTMVTHQFLLDDELNGKNWVFVDLFETTFKKALVRADSIVNKLLQKPFDFSVDESISRSKNKEFAFATDVKALSGRWLRYLKYRALDQMYDIVADDSTGKTTFKSVIANNEIKAREQVRLAETKSLKKILEYPAGFSNHVSELFLDAIATGFDPHTNYFSAQGKEEFQAALSGEELSFGVELDEDEKGQVIIDMLVPGGPAWKSGELNKGDELLSLQWEGKLEVEMNGAMLEDAYDILDEPVEGRLVFRVRKADGTTKTVLLRKEKIESEENIVKSYVLKGEKKIGYILLPGFYTEWENESGSSCANDVAKEIVKLKKENIEGLILDVRYNGGGSMGEAIDMLGIFVDEGPLFAHKQKDGKLVSLKDPNRGTIYNGPMALMVNGQSASASEIVAASLQDYNRAVIIGSNTYGKATMQQMFALDTFTNKPNAIAKGKDMVKITNGKLYRLNGETAQLTGVKPDVVLPDAFDWIDYREKFSPFALSAEAATKNNYYKPLPALPIAELVNRSTARINSSREFSGIRKLVDEMKGKREKPETIPLKWEAFEQWAKKQDMFSDLPTETLLASEAKFSVDNHNLDKVSLANNDYAKEINSIWLTNIAENIYIHEAFLVLCDLINLQKK